MRKSYITFLVLLMTMFCFQSFSHGFQEEPGKKKTNKKSTSKKSYTEVTLPDGKIKCIEKDGTVKIVDPAEIAIQGTDSNCKMNITPEKPTVKVNDSDEKKKQDAEERQKILNGD